MFQYSPDHNALFDGDRDVTWRADMDDASNGGISIVGSTLYVDSFDHRVYALDALTGALKWKRTLDDVLMNVPIVVHGVVIVGTGRSGVLQFSNDFWTSGRSAGDSIYGLDATTGKILWRFQTVGENMPTGVYVVGNGLPQFVFANGDDHVYSLDPMTGKLLWKEMTLGIDGMASLTIADGRVIGETTLSDAGYLQAQDSPDHAGDYHIGRGPSIPQKMDNSHGTLPTGRAMPPQWSATEKYSCKAFIWSVRPQQSQLNSRGRKDGKT